MLNGHHGFPASICASKNDVTCHGFPDSTPLIEGDVITIDYEHTITIDSLSFKSITIHLDISNKLTICLIY